jgi:hypothetical protein
MVAQIYKRNCASEQIGAETLNIRQILRFRRFFYMSAAPLRWIKLVSSTNILVHYRENQNVGRTSPIRLNALYSIGWSGAEIETQVFKMAAKFRDKRT